LYSSHGLFRVVVRRRLKWTSQKARMEEENMFTKKFVAELEELSIDGRKIIQVILKEYVLKMRSGLK
jgi:hypothetical protein